MQPTPTPIPSTDPTAVSYPQWLALSDLQSVGLILTVGLGVVILLLAIIAVRSLR
jgi:hypothetical protein